MGTGLSKSDLYFNRLLPCGYRRACTFGVNGNRQQTACEKLQNARRRRRRRRLGAGIPGVDFRLEPPALPGEAVVLIPPICPTQSCLLDTCFLWFEFGKNGKCMKSRMYCEGRRTGFYGTRGEVHALPSPFAPRSNQLWRKMALLEEEEEPHLFCCCIHGKSFCWASWQQYLQICREISAAAAGGRKFSEIIGLQFCSAFTIVRSWSCRENWCGGGASSLLFGAFHDGGSCGFCFQDGRGSHWEGEDATAATGRATENRSSFGALQRHCRLFSQDFARGRRTCFVERQFHKRHSLLPHTGR